VEETVEVLKPEDGMDEPADPAAGAEGEGEPVPPVVEKPRKSWWSRMF
jgi:hypothetical protein